ncbi:MAG: hypothetical protein ACI3ZK_05505 [Candidatus Cryptobacteroides sp.]
MKTSSVFLAGFCLCLGCLSCSTTYQKAKIIEKEGLAASLRLPSEQEIRRYGAASGQSSAPAPGGGYLMRRVVDDQSGEESALEKLDAAVLVARFRNTCERQGKVNFEFLLVASDSLQDPSWQLRFFPVLHFGDDTLALQPVYLTGEDFRNAQLEGYRRFADYERSLSRDSSYFYDRRQIEAFRERFPDTPDSVLQEHFSRKWMKRYNALRLSKKEQLRSRYISNPLADSGVRKDSTSGTGEQFVYLYRQTIPTRPGLKKFDLSLEGGIYNSRGLVCSLRSSEPITYYVSSLSTLADASLCLGGNYKEGLNALESRDFEKALEILAPYGDYNSALCYLCLDYNATAAALLENMEQRANVCYLLSLSYARRGLDEQSREMISRAVELEPQYRYRGNLDPEIAAIIREYKLFEQDDYSCESFL